MNKLQAAKHALILLRKSKENITEDDISATMEIYQLKEKQVDDFLVWILENNMIGGMDNQDETSLDYSGSYFNELSQYPTLTAEEERQLGEKARKGDKVARDTMINGNLRLVVAIAGSYKGRLPLNDLIQEGNIGLLKAVNHYDPALNVPFAHYAQYWIRQAMSRAIAQNHIIHLPINMTDTIKKLRRKERELEQSLGYRPTEKQLAEAMDMTEKEIQQLLSYELDAVSADQEISDDERVTILEIVPSDYDLNDDVDHRILRDELRLALNTLTEREQKIIRMRYGLDGYTSHTLQQIAEQFGLTKERVRQLIDGALNQLKVTGINLMDFRVK